MLEDDEFTHGHLAAGGGVIVFKHVEYGLPKQRKVVFGEAGGYAGEIRGDEALCAVERIRHNVLASHFGALLFCVGLGGDSDAGYGDFLRDDRVYGAGEANLHRASDLTTVERAFYKRRHYRAKGADVIIICAHIVAQFAVYFWIALLCGFEILRDAERGYCGSVAAVEGDAVLDVYAVAVLVLFQRFNIVAYFALEAYVGHKAVTGLGVNAGHIACVRIAVGISVFHIEQDHKIIAVFYSFRHFSFPPYFSFHSVSASDDSSRAGMPPVPAGSCGRESPRESCP